jgi:ferredoxin-NADP reductase
VTDLAPGAAATEWQVGTVTEIRQETALATTFRFALERATGHVPGQHLVVRLTAPDGYQASRSYSIANPPDGSGEVELTVERLEGGEVSSFLHDVVEVGDEIELRGPIGGWFVWDGSTPALLLGGGSGVVPLVAMLRHARNLGRSDLLRLVVSVRRPEDLLYAAELTGPEVTVLYTREAPPGDARPVGRLDVGDLPADLSTEATAYVCGSSGFADHATRVLGYGGVPTTSIRVERFGPTGTT